MQTIGNPIAASPRSFRHIALSTAAHALAILVVAGVLHSTVHIAPYRLPGTAQGHNSVVAYLPDRAPEESASAKPQPAPKPTPPKPLLPTPTPQPQQAPAPSVSNPTASPNPNAATGADALGEGNITIALTAYFPSPRPDLSHLPHGTRGDVVLDIVIDTDGHISDLKKLRGLDDAVDATVIAMVQQWTFHPAMQNGHPVPSEQELHFHYERS